MVRLMLNDELWSKLWTIMRQNGVYDKPSLRQTVEAILYRMRVGCPWRDLPSDFGNWNSIYKKFNYWSKNNILMSIFYCLITDPDFENKFVDGSFIKAYQHSTGATGLAAPHKIIRYNNRLHVAINNPTLLRPAAWPWGIYTNFFRDHHNPTPRDLFAGSSKAKIMAENGFRGQALRDIHEFF